MARTIVIALRTIVTALGAFVALMLGAAATQTHQESPTAPPPYAMIPALTPAPTPPPPLMGAEAACLPEWLPQSCVPLSGPIPGIIGWGERLV